MSGQSKHRVFSAFEVGLLSQPCVYKVFSKENRLFYVGASKYGISRFLTNTHIQREVIGAADRVEVQFFDTKDQAFAAEKEAIALLAPENNCGGAAYRKERSLVGTETICPQCGNPFIMKREWHRFCSDDCRNVHWAIAHP